MFGLFLSIEERIKQKRSLINDGIISVNTAE